MYTAYFGYSMEASMMLSVRGTTEFKGRSDTNKQTTCQERDMRQW